MLTVNCPSCMVSLQAKPSLAGKVATCPACGADVPVSAPGIELEQPDIEVIGAAPPAERFASFVEDVLSEPEPVRKTVHRDEQLRELPIVTAPMIVLDGKRMVRMLTTVSAVRCYGTGPLMDFSVGLRDAVGGRAQTLESAISKLYTELRRDIHDVAALKGASAVVSFHVEFGQLGKAAIFALATGTPVVLE